MSKVTDMQRLLAMFEWLPECVQACDRTAVAINKMR